MTSYNLQEVGLASAFKKKGYSFDVMYYSSRNYDQVIDKNGTQIKILWRRGIKFFRSGIYLDLLSRKKLEQYDIVIISEYSQIMSLLISYFSQNVYIYNGPYYNLFKIKFFEKIYDAFFCKVLNKRIKCFFCKTHWSEYYLRNKGLNNCKTVGVGLDISDFDKIKSPKKETKILIDKMRKHRNLLYVGSLSKRKNCKLIIKMFNKLKENTAYDDVQLVIIGNGTNNYVEECLGLVNKKNENDFVYVKNLENTQLSYIYKEASLFLLPSTKEIFGMVLLEAMYFGLPVISSNNAGANTLIADGTNGYVVKSHDVSVWLEKVKWVLDNESFINDVGVRANKTIIEKFLWKNVMEKMINEFN
ncbi:glycosyltransferase family 4 protein [Liquorilactobacillus hordei]|uniref:glycosyltransferase family 4 protein n=1 Tax=Liquorilactobacillus hordei TaxID=468911 RepID=UPI0039E8C09F